MLEQSNRSVEVTNVFIEKAKLTPKQTRAIVALIFLLLLCVLIPSAFIRACACTIKILPESQQFQGAVRVQVVLDLGKILPLRQILSFLCLLNTNTVTP